MAIDIALERVTPENAENWLANRAPNRPTNVRRIRQYARDMKEGDWAQNGVPIIFSTKKQLLDGQNRLSAIIETGKAVQLVIVRGVKESAMTTIDIGLGRKLKDFLQISGEMYGSSLAATIRYLWRWEQYHTFVRNDQRERDPTIQECLEMFAERADEFRFAATYGAQKAPRAHISSSLIASIYMIFTAFDETDATDFFDRAASGADMGEWHPIMRLRSRMRDDKLALGVTMRSEVKAALTIKAWNAYRAGNDVQVLSWKAGGAHPEPFPQPV